MAVQKQGHVLTPEFRVPKSWSELSWQQLEACWQAKISYGGKPDVARAAALLAITGCEVCHKTSYDEKTAEALYYLHGKEGSLYCISPRQLSQMARQAIMWFDFPYGDPGEPPVKDKSGRVTKEARDPVRGYVGPMRDALALPEEHVTVGGTCFALPQVACNNVTWQQYRSLQAIAPQLFQEGITEAQVISLQSQFLAHCLVPPKESEPTADRFQPRYTYTYNKERAEETIPFWKERLAKDKAQSHSVKVQCLFHICFQCYQTAVTYYAQAYPLLFAGGDKNDAMRDALQGEVGTINSIMKYQGYNDPQQVYDTDLPIIFDTLNTMTKEAKEIEKMNAKIKKK